MNHDNILIIVLFCIITFLILYKDLDKKVKNSLLIISILYILYLVLNKVQNLADPRRSLLDF